MRYPHLADSIDKNYKAICARNGLRARSIFVKDAAEFVGKTIKVDGLGMAVPGKGIIYISPTYLLDNATPQSEVDAVVMHEHSHLEEVEDQRRFCNKLKSVGNKLSDTGCGLFFLSALGTAAHIVLQSNPLFLIADVTLASLPVIGWAFSENSKYLEHAADRDAFAHTGTRALESFLGKQISGDKTPFFLQPFNSHPRVRSRVRRLRRMGDKMGLPPLKL